MLNLLDKKLDISEELAAKKSQSKEKCSDHLSLQMAPFLNPLDRPHVSTWWRARRKHLERLPQFPLEGDFASLPCIIFKLSHQMRRQGATLATHDPSGKDYLIIRNPVNTSAFCPVFHSFIACRRRSKTACSDIADGSGKMASHKLHFWRQAETMDIVHLIDGRK